MYNVKYIKRKNIVRVSANVPTVASRSNRARYIACRCTDSERSSSRTLYTLRATLILYMTGYESSRSLRSSTACNRRKLLFALRRYS